MSTTKYHLDWIPSCSVFCLYVFSQVLIHTPAFCVGGGLGLFFPWREVLASVSQNSYNDSSHNFLYGSHSGRFGTQMGITRGFS